MKESIKKTSIASFFALFGLVLSVVFSAGATMAVFAETFTLLTADAFDYTIPNSNDILKCFPIDGEARSVAVAWGKANPSDTPASLTIPSRVYKQGDANAYVVKAIAKSGFRYCDFEEINLPSTISEIQTEAFYCCLGLEEFTIPYQVTQIAPSTFMDCRNLEKINYSTQTYNGGNPVVDELGDPVCEPTNSNTLINVIGDHAFTSCVSLKSFDCPTPNSTLGIGDSAFQNCKNMMSFFFPLTTPSISVGEHAFSDCEKLTVCYFGNNVTQFGQYAFARDDKLTIYYAQEKPSSFGSGFDANWRKKHPATDKNSDPNKLSGDFVPIADKSGVLEYSDDYPGLYYTVKNGPIKLDGADNQKVLDSSTSKYISVFKFETPDPKSGYYVDGYLTLPETIKTKDKNSYPLKVIESNAFLNNKDITGISFNSNLVQICSRAFYGVSNLTGENGLSFIRCSNLKAISFEVFQGNDEEATPPNTTLTHLKLPSCLNYVGYRAFYNFKNVSSFAFQAGPSDTSDPQIKWIAEAAFANLGASKNGSVDLVLPKSLNDAECESCKPKSVTGGIAKYAIQKSAFLNAKLFKSITMEAVDLPEGWSESTPPAFDTIKSYLISIGQSAFEGCSNVIRFKANKFHHIMAQDCFKGCSSMKEMFLSTYGSTNSNKNFPWGYAADNKDQSSPPIFGTGSSIVDLVIYVDGNSAPKSNATPRDTQWNSENATFKNDYSTNTFILSRPNVPTYFGIDWANGDVKYIDLNNNVVTETTNFANDVIAFIDEDGSYLLTRCYAKNDISEINLCGIKDNLNDETATASAKISIIGAGAFGQDNSGKKPGTKFVLPTGLKEIRERAFYRSKTSNGVSKVTYGTVTVNDGDCKLPSGLERLERLAFYNCRFINITLDCSALDFFGNTAFTSFPTATTDTNTLNETVTSTASGTQFYVSNNGIYYDGNDSNKTLLHQAGIGSGENPSLTLDSDIVALGVRSLANTNYKTITLPSSLTTIYGGALEHNKKLTKVVGGSGLKYIAAASVSSNTEDIDVWNNNTHFDILDSASTTNSGKFSWVSTFGAFAYSAALETFDFTALTNLRKIGYGAFQACTALKYMTPYSSPSDQYKYYKYSSGTVGSLTKTEYSAPSNNEGILDLSKCVNLESIGRYAFGECMSIVHVHLPNNPNLYIRTDHDNSYAEAGSYSVFASDPVVKNSNGLVLFGEKAINASYKQGGTNAVRYPGNSLVSDDKKLYYYVENANDIIPGKGEIRYWTNLGNNEFLLFDHFSKVQAYYS